MQGFCHVAIQLRKVDNFRLETIDMKICHVLARLWRRIACILWIQRSARSFRGRGVICAFRDHSPPLKLNSHACLFAPRNYENAGLQAHDLHYKAIQLDPLRFSSVRKSEYLSLHCWYCSRSPPLLLAASMEVVCQRCNVGHYVTA